MSDLEDFKARVEILEEAVRLLEQRLASVMETQYLEPYIVELNEEDANKIKNWLREDDYYLPARFRDIANGE